MESFASEPKDHLTYKEIADCLLNMAQTLLAYRQDILRMKAATGNNEPSRSQIIEESVKEIPQEQLDSIFEANNQAEASSCSALPISPVSESEVELKKPVTPPSTKEGDKANLHKLLVLVSSGGMQPNPQSPPITAKTFGEICELTKKIKEESLSPSRMDAPLFIKTEPVELGSSGDDWSNDRKYECDQCSKKFANKFLLKKHQFIHTGAQPFKCDLCHRTFNRKDNMVRHRKTPHSVIDNSEKDSLPTATVTPRPDPVEIPTIASHSEPVEINQYLATAMSTRLSMPKRFTSTSPAAE